MRIYHYFLFLTLISILVFLPACSSKEPSYLVDGVELQVSNVRFGHFIYGDVYEELPTYIPFGVSYIEAEPGYQFASVDVSLVTSIAQESLPGFRVVLTDEALDIRYESIMTVTITNELNKVEEIHWIYAIPLSINQASITFQDNTIIDISSFFQVNIEDPESTISPVNSPSSQIRATPTLPVSAGSCVDPYSYREFGRVIGVLNCKRLNVDFFGSISQIDLLGMECPQGSDTSYYTAYLSTYLLGKRVLIVYDGILNNEQLAGIGDAVPSAYVFIGELFFNKMMETQTLLYSPQGEFGCSAEFQAAYIEFLQSLYPNWADYVPPQIHIPDIPTPHIPDFNLP